MTMITTDNCWVGKEHLLVPGANIRWKDANGKLVSATIVTVLPGIAFKVDNEDGSSCEIYIEKIKEVEKK